MRDDVKALIAKIEGGDPSAREDAVLALMYRMEDSTRQIAKHEVIGDEYLSQDEQLELIHVLIELAESLRPEYAGLLWVVGKANPIVMIDPVQNFVLKHANKMPSNMLRQSLAALQNCMCTKDFKYFEAIKAKFKYGQLKATLREIKPQDEILLRDDILQDTLSSMDAFYNQ